jgi:hypothetical protein
MLDRWQQPERFVSPWSQGTRDSAGQNQSASPSEGVARVRFQCQIQIFLALTKFPWYIDFEETTEKRTAPHPSDVEAYHSSVPKFSRQGQKKQICPKVPGSAFYNPTEDGYQLLGNPMLQD